MAVASPAAPVLRRLACGLALGFAFCAQAHGQQMGSNSADYNAGYGRVAGSENRPVDVSTRDGNGNRVIVDGLILTGEDQSTFSRTTGVFDSYTGVGAQGGATAIGNSLVVVTQGNYNTVIVNSTQTNTGNVSASATASSGGVGNGQ